MDKKPRLVYEGEMYKRVSGWNFTIGGKWRRRHWQLFDDGLLVFSKPSMRGNRKIRGKVQLSPKSYVFQCHFMKEIIEDYPRSVDEQCCFSIITPQRNFHLYSLNSHDQVVWRRKIEEVVDQLCVNAHEMELHL